MNHKKKAISDLALFGASPHFQIPLSVGRPNICNREALFIRLHEATDRLWLTNDGPLLLEMESRFAQFLEVKHCIAVANATLGLQLLVHALGLKGDVLMPSFTFIGTARAIEWSHLRPRFCDVLDSRSSLDPNAVRKAITPDVSAILGVHLWGLPCEIESLQVIADEFGIPLFFDAAHATGSAYKGKKIGGFGCAEVFSLHATKAINALEGGLVTTNNDDLAKRVRLARNYGIVDEDLIKGTGINAKMNEYSAAMAISNLEGYDKLVRHNQGLQRTYLQGLNAVPGVELVTASNPDEHNSHYAVLRVSSESPLSRDELGQVLRAEKIHSRKYFWPGCHRSPPYDQWSDHPEMPVTELLAAELLQLPTGMQMNRDDAMAIGELIVFAIQNAQEIRESMALLKNDWIN